MNFKFIHSYLFFVVVLIFTLVGNELNAQVRRTTVVHSCNHCGYHGNTYVHHGPTYIHHGPTVVHGGPVVVHVGPPIVVHPAYVGAPMWGPYWHPVGYTVATIAATAVIVHAIDENNNSKDFYCDNGVYYEKTDNGKYQVVAAPIGSTIKKLPKGYITIVMGGNTYYYYAGNYYKSINNNYTVITAPMNAVVTVLPEGTKTVIVDGKTYYTCNGAWYKAETSDSGKIEYIVVSPKN